MLEAIIFFSSKKNTLNKFKPLAKITLLKHPKILF